MPYKDKEKRLKYWSDYSKINRANKSTHTYKYWLKLKYKLTLEEYEDLLIKQNFKCALCAKHVSENKRRLCVDHDHETGRVRGLLCTRCNSLLGELGDSVEGVMKYVDYLKFEDVRTGP